MRKRSIHSMREWLKVSKPINIWHINRTKTTLISLDRYRYRYQYRFIKAFDGIQHPFLFRPLNKLSIVRMYLNIIKTANMPKLIPYWTWKGWGFSKTLNKITISIFTTFIQYSIRSSSQNKARARNEGYANWKGGIKIVTIWRWFNLIYKDTSNLQTPLP